KSAAAVAFTVLVRPHDTSHSIFAVPHFLRAVFFVLSATFGMAAVSSGGFNAQAQQPTQSQSAKPKPPAQTTPMTQASAPTGTGAQPQLLGQYGDWGAYTATPGGKKICFALAKPAGSQTNPANRPRDPAYMFISSRPTEKVKDEVS